MKRILFIALVFCFWEPATVAAGDAQSGTLTVVVKGFRHQRGKLRLVVARGANGFKNESKAAVTRVVAIDGGSVKVVVQDVAHGEIAIKVHHDEDGNGKLKTNFLGIPKEPVGMHRPNFPKARAPRFDDAKFTFNQKELEITIQLR